MLFYKWWLVDYHAQTSTKIIGDLITFENQEKKMRNWRQFFLAPKMIMWYDHDNNHTFACEYHKKKKNKWEKVKVSLIEWCEIRMALELEPEK